MIWEWDQEKNRSNLRIHDIEFETAILVFDDPLSATIEDPYPDEQRWRTTGVVGTAAVVVVHTSLGTDPETGEEIGRIIIARKLSRQERRSYEGGHV